MHSLLDGKNEKLKYHWNLSRGEEAKFLSLVGSFNRKKTAY